MILEKFNGKHKFIKIREWNDISTLTNKLPSLKSYIDFNFDDYESNIFRVINNGTILVFGENTKKHEMAVVEIEDTKDLFYISNFDPRIKPDSSYSVEAFNYLISYPLNLYGLKMESLEEISKYTESSIYFELFNLKMPILDLIQKNIECITHSIDQLKCNCLNVRINSKNPKECYEFLNSLNNLDYLKIQQFIRDSLMSQYLGPYFMNENSHYCRNLYNREDIYDIQENLTNINLSPVDSSWVNSWDKLRECSSEEANRELIENTYRKFEKYEKCTNSIIEFPPLTVVRSKRGIKHMVPNEYGIVASYSQDGDLIVMNNIISNPSVKGICRKDDLEIIKYCENRITPEYVKEILNIKIR